MYNLQHINGIKDVLVRDHETLAVAESVTSGDLQSAFSQAREATLFYQGGITTYNLNQKTRLLNIDPVHAMACNCVSEEVARQMAIGVSKMFSTPWSIAITGYASPIPEMSLTDLYAYFALSHHGKIVLSRKIKGLKNDPAKVQLHYTNEVIREFFIHLKAKQ